MWLTLIWQNKGLVALAACAAVLIGLVVAYKVQTTRLETRTKELAEVTAQRDVAIEAHDALTKEYARQQSIIAQRIELAKKQEQQNEKLHQTIRDILKSHQAWAGASLPAAVVSLLVNLPLSSMQPEVGPPAPAPVK